MLITADVMYSLFSTEDITEEKNLNRSLFNTQVFTALHSAFHLMTQVSFCPCFYWMLRKIKRRLYRLVSLNGNAECTYQFDSIRLLDLYRVKSLLVQAVRHCLHHRTKLI